MCPLSVSAARRHINTSDRQSNAGVKVSLCVRPARTALWFALSRIVDPYDDGGGDVRTPECVGKASRSYQLVAGNLPQMAGAQLALELMNL
ncbi:hypothetical protein F442_15392 [Phytophthora nicotianae P10297]|uniref:Uncharacterized protein n=4 Tax=Phytophthora nicotianae TaxID=4792 RepID=W2R3Z4_PHYN3|nr:hypothetical protein PPTG_21435 [Phytophthora nicotianae INRA-310]ETI38801.1 hypothetical protein F443_15554 [Phytophthora nicotianae P1569]ETN19225.1 hypothetical protein PPTG_21435 [Phytophthora nicotianae INRA-310]ETO67550.1 hypothetical protein F444_15547 [Phytophthora nicotianae P1976]ETP36737.1 hypothetical protein F442_15392 [Phytophthora nicotianae P10297]